MSARHARLSASAAHRWLHCAGSVGGENSTSVYAAAGTYAHSIAAACLSDVSAIRAAAGMRAPSVWLGNKTIVDGFTVECDQDMVDAVQVYLNAVADDLEPGDLTWVEMPLLTALQQVDLDMGGTADYVRYRPSTKHLKVMDFKFGSGTYVEADDNEQMKVYALGAMIESKQLIHEVEIVIVQPRHEGAVPVRPYTFKAVDILDFMADLQEAADRTRRPLPQFVAGDWCHFCSHARTCPELERKHHELVAVDFDTLLASGERVQSALVVDPTKLAAALASIPLVKERIKAIEEFAYAEATKGLAIPGFKLVDKRPVRSWKSQGDVIEWAEAHAVEPYAPRELLSPAQLEKKLAESAPKGQKKEAGKVLEPFIQKLSSGTVLVSVDDERAPAKLISSTDFDLLESK